MRSFGLCRQMESCQGSVSMCTGKTKNCYCVDAERWNTSPSPNAAWPMWPIQILQASEIIPTVNSRDLHKILQPQKVESPLGASNESSSTNSTVFVSSSATFFAFYVLSTSFRAGHEICFLLFFSLPAFLVHSASTLVMANVFSVWILSRAFCTFSLCQVSY